MNEMIIVPNALELFMDVLWLFFVWSLVIALMAIPVLFACWLFGRNPNPPGVPNKAVWG
jgi:hypothetical protein